MNNLVVNIERTKRITFQRLFIHLAKLQTKNVCTKKSHGLLRVIRLMCFKNYKVILVCTSVTMIYNECKVFQFGLFTVALAVIFKKNPFVGVEMSPLVLALIKHLPRRFSNSPLNTGTQSRTQSPQALWSAGRRRPADQRACGLWVRD